MAVVRKSVRRLGASVELDDGMKMIDLIADVQRSFPGVPLEDILFDLSVNLDNDVTLTPSIMVPEPEDEYQQRVMHETRIAQERVISQAASDREKRRMLYEKLKSEFEGGHL